MAKHFVAHKLLYEKPCSSRRVIQVSGDVATNIAVAQACMLQRNWAGAAELYLLAFALVVLAPWADCLTLTFWDLTSSDVVFNAARFFAATASSAGTGRVWPAATAVRTMAWRRPKNAARLARRLMPEAGQRELWDGSDIW
eukprot:Skav221950  [mRNA]  locus=scaffold195:537685:538866:- [translate_table: standard]